VRENPECSWRQLGYLRVAFFPGVNGHRFAQALDRALAELPACSSLIIDLRGNLGGSVGSLRLISTLTAGRVPVGYSLTRRREDRGWRPEQLPCIDSLPTTKLEMLKMAVRFKVVHRDRSIRLVTEGLGPRPFHGHVVMLVNEHTLSAGEMVAAFAKENQLANVPSSGSGRRSVIAMPSAAPALGPRGEPPLAARHPSPFAGQLAVRAGTFPVYLIRRCTKGVEDVLDERQGDLSFSRVNAVCPGVL